MSTMLKRSGYALVKLPLIGCSECNYGNSRISGYLGPPGLTTGTGKTDDAIKTYRSVADAKSVLVPRPLVLIELADLLSQSKPAEAATLYEQIKKEYPSSAVSERADRGLDMLATPKS